MTINVSEASPKVTPAGIAELEMRAEADKIKAGVELIHTVEKQTQKVQQENKDSSPQQTQIEEENENRTDEAALSKESRLHHLTLEEIKKIVKTWTLEMMGELWEQFVNWQPVPGKSLAENLNQLAKLFQALQQAVLTNTTGEEQAIQLQRLDQALSQTLNLLIKNNLGQLISFFEQFGMKESIHTVKQSLYRLVTGNSISPSDIERFWQQGNMVQKQNYDIGTGSANRLVGTGNQPSGTARQMAGAGGISQTAQSAGFSHQGVIYQTNQQGKVVADKQFHSQIQNHPGRERIPVNASSGAKTTDYAAQNSRQSQIYQSAPIGGGKGTAQNGKLFTGNDMEQLGKFTTYMRTEGNLFENPKITGKSEELVGVLASATAIKGQEFSQRTQMSSAAKSTIRNAVDTMVDYYIQQHKRNLQQQAEIRQDERSIYKVYHQTLNEYQQTKDPFKAISQGILYALEQFQMKKADGGYFGVARYAELAGFFSSGAQSQALLEQNERLGRLALERDWKVFSKYMALFLEPEKFKDMGVSKQALIAFGIFAAGLAVIIFF